MSQEEEKIYQILAKEFAGEISDIERYQLEKWQKASPLNKNIYLTLKRAWNENSLILDSAKEERLFQKIAAEIKSMDPEKRELNTYRDSTRRKNNYWKYVAAAIVLTIAATWTVRKLTEVNDKKVVVSEIPYVEKTNPNGQKSNIQLSDGTVIIMNAGSRIRYPARFPENERMIELEGEAFFTVSTDPKRPFRVLSGTLSTTALGTAFNVKAFNNDESMRISLLEGKVVVNRTDQPLDEGYLLSPGESIEYNKKNHNVTKIKNSLESDLSWTKGVIIFKSASIQEIIHKLERWYGVKFIIERKKPVKKGFTGSFKNKSLDEVLKGISFSSDFQYEINDKVIVIK